MCIKTNERSLSFYMKITTLCTYLGSTQSYSCVCSHVHVPQRDAGCLQMFSTLFSEAGSVSEHKARQFSWTGWSESPRDPGLQTRCCTWLLLRFPFKCGCWNQTEILMLSQQTFYQPRHLPSPPINPLF